MGLFSKIKSVDKVVGGMRKVLADLDKVEHKRTAETEKIDGQIGTLSSRRKTAECEAERAKKVRSNLEKLLEV